MKRTLISILAALSLSLGCGDDDISMDSGPAIDGAAADAAGETVSLNFSAVVGAMPFACGQVYAGLGTASETWTAQDLRFYVYDVELVLGDGSSVPVALDDDGMWQNGQVALLDFEDGCGEMGNSDMNMVVRGQAPAGEYTGVRFKIGVPEELNHANAATAGAPLNLTSMFWNWNGGYKFVRIEGPMGGFAEWRLHLGSTMCEGDMVGNATCATSNRPEVEVMGDVAGTIQLDLEALFANSPLNNTEETQPGCMAAPTDMDCAPLFMALGLDFAGVSAGAQQVFSIQ